MQLCRTGLLMTLALLALGGCVSAHKLDLAMAIPLGMNEAQVANKIGQPVLKDRQEDGTERWVWSRDGQFGPESVTVVMKDGRVAAVESEGERLEHLAEIRRLEEMEAVLQDRDSEIPPEQKAIEARAALARREGRVLPIRIERTNAPPVSPAETVLPSPQHEKSSEVIWREQQEALAQAQQQARIIEEQTRVLVEKARQDAASEIRAAEAAKTRQDEQEVPAFTAWYMARQFVSEKLAGKRRLFPNPRFATDATGEERIGGNVWRAWGYVDTVDSNN